MARGKAVGRFEAALGLIGVVALAVTVSVITGWNPLPRVQKGVEDWLARTGSIAEPPAKWVKRVGGQPTAAVVAGSAVIVTMRGTIEGRSLTNGEVLWSREADWAAVAGDENAAVAVVGRRGFGLEVVDPATGAAKWKDGSAVGAWTYRDMVLTLSCGGLSDCTLKARDPGTGAMRWKGVLPGVGRVHAGANSPLLGSRTLANTYHQAVEASPHPVPALLGIPVDGRVTVLDTADGARLREQKPSSTSRVVVLGDRVIVSTAVPRNGNCRYTLEARDPSSGATVWKKDGIDLRTSSGAGCEQRRDPPGGGSVLAATRGDNRDVFLSVDDGHEIWVGAEGETAIATDGRYGVVRSADRKTIKVIDLGSGATLGHHDLPPKANVALTRYCVLVEDPATTQLVAYAPRTAAVMANVKTSGDVIGYGPTGLMLGRGRTIGFVPYT